MEKYMPLWLAILGGVAGIIGAILSIYKQIDDRIGAKKKQMDDIKEKLTDHDVRLTNAERVTGVIEDFMDELLLEQLKSKRK